KGEPDVTINGKSLRMVQATDGNWYAYFANVDKAKIADSTVGEAGKGLDFGVFCGRNTNSSILGIDISETDGVAVPYSSGLDVGTFTNGKVSFSSCTGTIDDSGINQNNVVRKAKSINTNSPLDGQIGLKPAAWPLIQLYSFNDVTIQYNPGGGVQQVDLEYDEIPNISLEIDRDNYPQNSQVFLTINDIQLNQDPTDEDSWTFNIDSPNAVFYQAYDNNGQDAANGGDGLVNLSPYLSSLGFEENGIVSADLGKIMELTKNSEQENDFVSDGSTSFSQIITLVEEGPYSGIFDTADDNDQSIIRILGDAPRGETGSIEYDDQSISVLSGFSTASVSFEPSLKIGDGSTSLRAGTEFPVILEDPDQNTNSGARDDLDNFRDSALIPTLEIGNPVTLESASNVKFYKNSNDDLSSSGIPAGSSVPDKNSDRLIIDTSKLDNSDFEKISFNLGISASNLKSALIDTTKSNSYGTNWLNYDLRSFSRDLGVNDFSDASVELLIGSLSSSPITIVNPGQMASSGLIQLSDSDVKEIFSKSGSVYVVINFDASNNSFGVGEIPNENNKQPIVMDFFSFGIVNGDDVNNSIYRFELEETSDNSSIFEGTLEYAVVNQLNIFDAGFIQTIRTIDDEIKFIVTDRMVDEEGVSINYSDLADVGVFITTSVKSDIQTTSGGVFLESTTYRFGQPVKFTLIDPDLNLKNDRIDTYQVINDPNSPNVDTVGNNGNILLEILIKDIRYQRCTINGVETGGLGSTGFSLVETGYDTGVFEGVFKMPS
ncbi:MAG: peptidase, partial [Nitrosopumilaceae archaeon]